MATDRETFLALVDRHGAGALGMLRRLCGSGHDAEDVFQREVAALKDRDRILEEKFREALKRAEEDPDQGRPARPFDLD